MLAIGGQMDLFYRIETAVVKIAVLALLIIALAKIIWGELQFFLQ